MKRPQPPGFLRDKRGTAAVEFATIMPVLVIMVLAALALWRQAGSMQDARSALSVGADYYMAGGANDAYATSLVKSEWNHAPSGAEVTASRTCRCGTTVLACTAYCDAGTPPEVFVTLAATAPKGVGLATAISEQAVLRVR